MVGPKFTEKEASELLIETYEILIKDRDFDDTLSSIQKTIFRFFPHCRVTLSKIDEAGFLTVIDTCSPSNMPSIEGLRADLNLSPEFFTALKKGSPLPINDIEKSKLLASLSSGLRELGALALLEVPIFFSEKLVGLLCIDHPQIHKWTLTEISTMHKIVDALKSTYTIRALRDEQQRIQEALIESDARFKQMADQFEHVFWMATYPENRVLYVSPAYERIWGQPCQKFYDSYQSFFESIHPEDKERVYAAQSLLPLGTYDIRFRVLDTEHRTTWVRSRAYPIGNRKGEIYRIVGVSEDITKHRESERALTEARQIAETASRIKSTFLATMSHEMRTPLNGILGMSTLMLDSELTTEQREFTKYIKSSGETLLTLVNDLLDLSKIEAGKIELEEAPYSPHELIGDLLDLLHGQIKAKGLSLNVTFDKAVPRWVKGTSQRIEQVITNLVTNAIKFTHQGSISISVTPCIVAEQSGLRFTISDTGIGIASCYVDQLFKPFQQLDGSATRRYGGSGLGLAICKKLVSAMGGEIHVESQEGYGTTFWFTVKAPALEGTEIPASTRSNSAEIADPNTLPISAIRVLLVEDNVLNQKLAKIILEREGCTVSLAGNGKEALNLWKKETFDLILMDCSMPIMDGFDATQEIRREGSFKSKIPIIAMTALAMSGDRERCLEVGMTDYISKPLDHALLREKIRKFGGLL